MMNIMKNLKFYSIIQKILTRTRERVIVNRHSIFAIVDIETTGTNLEQDKIIQFGCVLVQDGQVINQFSTDLNPLCHIPKAIEQLTGISNKQVAKAPYFEDVSYFIRQLLEDCVFVAHNAYFDLSFLNSEFARCQERELAVESLDTVELSQIVYPSSPGHRVNDLAHYLGISHDQPHQALSDALVTAEIFIQLTQKLETLPQLTMKKIVELSDVLGMNNHQFLSLFLTENYHVEYVTEGYTVISELVLKKKSYQFMEHRDSITLAYPKSLEAKQTLFEPTFDLREPQVQMMDWVFDFLIEKPQKNLILEASTGIGKTLGYLVPTVLSSKKPLVVSTSTIMLQHQILTQELPKLSQITQYDWQGVVFKSSQHFIDLSRFALTLQAPFKQKQYGLYQMACLVWLLETDTGDLSELSLNMQHPFYDDIYHRGLSTLSKKSPFYLDDFVRYLYQKKEYADIILINHAFLMTDMHDLRDVSCLVVDEAHKLLPVIEHKGTARVSFKEIYYFMNQLKGMTFDDQQGANRQDFDRLHELTEMYQLMLNELKDGLQLIENFIFKHYRVNKQGKITKDFYFTEEDLKDNWSVGMRRELKQVQVLIQESQQVQKELTSYMLDKHLGHMIKSHWSTIDQLHEKLVVVHDYFKLFSPHCVKWFSYHSNHLVISQFDLELFDLEDLTWYQQFDKVIFTGGTLQLTVEDTYFENQLGLTDVIKHKTADLFDYTHHAKFLVYQDPIDFGDSHAYSHLISEMIKQLLAIDGVNRFLILFTSHQVLQQVYRQLSPICQQLGIELLAQNLTGSNEKIVKRYEKSNRVIVLGADSFWEGVDLSKHSLDILLITKLPFEPPSRPLVKAKNDLLIEQGKNPFYEEVLPKTGLRLRQGLGRLLRKETDRGIMLILDQRLMSSSYHEYLKSYLPKGLPINTASTTEIVDTVTDFFKKNN
ncbi:hypothetical protein CBF34_03005 [Vagococcus penaei]|nr:hypothetical protein CBF34_03005 [Vagococcus penaei]